MPETIAESFADYISLVCGDRRLGRNARELLEMAYHAGVSFAVNEVIKAIQSETIHPVIRLEQLKLETLKHSDGLLGFLDRDCFARGEAPGKKDSSSRRLE